MRNGNELPTAAELMTLAGMLGRLGSDQAGERDCAALMATRWVRSRGLNWSDVLVPALPEPKQPPPTQDDRWRVCVERCLLRASMLNAWEQGFLRDLRKFPWLSEKQAARLDAIASKIGVGPE